MVSRVGRDVMHIQHATKHKQIAQSAVVEAARAVVAVDGTIDSTDMQMSALRLKLRDFDRIESELHAMEKKR